LELLSSALIVGVDAKLAPDGSTNCPDTSADRLVPVECEFIRNPALRKWLVSENVKVGPYPFQVNAMVAVPNDAPVKLSNSGAVPLTVALERSLLNVNVPLKTAVYVDGSVFDADSVS
jgi:hypothetical protein